VLVSEKKFLTLSVYGGTYWLPKPIDKVNFDDEGKVAGVESNGEVCKCPLVIGDPTYFKDYDKTIAKGKIVRAVCIMDHPIPNTNDSKACQIIIPQKQTKRKNGLFLF
jgi:Rab GDP dissociation inhibitor